jgi:hypothetical protein
MGGVQVAIEQKVHIIPLGVQRWDGVFKAHPRKWSEFPGLLCVKL